METRPDITISREDELRAANSRVGKFIKDVMDKGKKGLVHSVVVEEEEVFLLARFQGEGQTDRKIALKRRSDGHYLDPDDPRTRYRPLSEREQAELDSRLSKSRN
jgi:hypothetical protein